MKYQINQNQCGFLLKDGRFARTLYCGTYHFVKALGYEVVVEDMEGAVKFDKVPKEILLEEDKAFAGKVLGIMVPEGHMGILKENGVAKKVLTEGEYLYWNVWNRYSMELLDMREPEAAGSVSKACMAQIPLKYYKKIEIQPGELGILYYDNQVVRELETGTYYYWVYAKDVVCRIVDLKVKPLEISGQEILTADRIGIRVNLMCTLIDI